MSSAILTSSALDAFARPERTSSPTPPRQTSSRPEQIMFDRPLGARQVEVHRDEAAIIRKLSALAKSAGEGWCYRIPVRNQRLGRTDYIEGPSIKLANDLARLYGNCDVETRVADLGDSWLITARFVDYETGYGLARPYQQRKMLDRQRCLDPDRTLDHSLQAGISKAIRNVIVNALQSFAEFALIEAKRATLARIQADLDSYRASTTAQITDLVPLSRAEIVIGRSAFEWGAADLARLIAMVKAINDGVITSDEAFPRPVTGEQAVPVSHDLATFAAAIDRKSPAATEIKPAESSSPSPTSLPDPSDHASGPKHAGSRKARPRRTVRRTAPPSETTRPHPPVVGSETSRPCEAAAPFPKPEAPACL